MADRNPEIAVAHPAELGEGPTWDAGTETLLWVDILGKAVHRYDPRTGVDSTLPTPQHVGAAKPRAKGGLVLNLAEGIALFDQDGEDQKWLVYWAREGVRGNDAAVDPMGRLWAGTMRYDTAEGGGWLARIEPDGAAKVMVDNVTISNGLGWSPDNTRMYYIDTPTGRIDVFDYDRDSGEISGRRPVVDVDRGSPDGMCVDADGCLWVALWGGFAVRRYTPDGRLDAEIELPVANPTAPAFGGPHFTDLYVTSARSGLSEAELAAQPDAGSLFVVPGAGTGLPSPVFTG
ncbi:sugar lactone lactonase YvrE [Crossiella equi]|uniref:Sugar lactone lactonase YvrE n=1 Tax=Crossiella equi TaxID=130796 RepID=A0ABS5AK34_9PSEU|nr:SMP-30/gluconolactonase/LRE family protein [Crossiella equi]MBP2476742.1 sugar lactone lactonase YvrE [Crossiella equi]